MLTSDEIWDSCDEYDHVEKPLEFDDQMWIWLDTVTARLANPVTAESEKPLLERMREQMLQFASDFYH